MYCKPEIEITCSSHEEQNFSSEHKPPAHRNRTHKLYELLRKPSFQTVTLNGLIMLPVEGKPTEEKTQNRVMSNEANPVLYVNLNSRAVGYRGEPCRRTDRLRQNSLTVPSISQGGVALARGRGISCQQPARNLIMTDPKYISDRN